MDGFAGERVADGVGGRGWEGSHEDCRGRFLRGLRRVGTEATPEPAATPPRVALLKLAMSSLRCRNLPWKSPEGGNIESTEMSRLYSIIFQAEKQTNAWCMSWRKAV